MENLKMICDYKNISEYRHSFNELARNTFGIDFEKWYQQGCWNDTYICYSYVDGERVVANISINKMGLLIEGKEYRAMQIGTVMTDPAYRRRGLAASLMKTVFDQYEKEFDLIFLFPDDDAMAFYQKFGFDSVKLYNFSAQLEPGQSQKGQLRKLDATNPDDLRMIVQLAKNRVPLSRVFDARDTQHILTWYCFNILPDYIYYLEDEEAVVFFRIKDEQLHLFDVISRREVDIDRIVRKIITDEVRKVVFHFTPDQSRLACNVSESDEVMFVRPMLANFTRKICFPMTARA